MITWNELGVERQRILRLLTVVQALRGSQVARLTASSYRLAMYHLEVLARAGLVDRVVITGGSKVWCASATGLRLLSRLVGQPVARLKSVQLAAHAAQVAEFLVRMLEERQGSLVLSAVGFRAEVELRPGLRCDALAQVGWELTPRQGRPAGSPLEGLVGNGQAGRTGAPRELALALEVDRGTMTLVRLARKAKLYAQYYTERWRWKKSYGAFPLPIVVTAGPARAGAIWLRWRQALGDEADWAVSCWEWLEGGKICGRWLNADGSVAALLESANPVPGVPDPAQADQQE